MKSKPNIKIIILITLGIIFAFSTIINNNLVFYSDEITLENENLKNAKVSGKIYINGNSDWADFKAAGNCTGEGTYSDPYVIEDLEIDGGSSGDCIDIHNSDVYFKIENCTLYNAGSLDSGIRLYFVTNGQLIDNDCSSAQDGIHLSHSDNNTISGNTVNNNYYNGIWLSYSNNNTISGNTANNNYENGLHIIWSNYNNISGNTIKSNEYGMVLVVSNYNTITDNKLIGNKYCILEDTCEGNIFENNDCVRKPEVPGYNIFFLLSILSIVSIIIGKKIKKSCK